MKDPTNPGARSPELATRNRELGTRSPPACGECERLRIKLEQVREALAGAREALQTMCGAEQIPVLMSEIDAALAAGGEGRTTNDEGRNRENDG